MDSNIYAILCNQALAIGLYPFIRYVKPSVDNLTPSLMDGTYFDDQRQIR
jgi:hypothetical protein